MKDYKRITERDEFGNADIIGLDSNELASNLDFDGLNKLTFALNKFADLEDKIESGEIDYVTDKDNEIARLTAEVAELRATISKMETVEKELRARVDNAVELKAKEGDTLFMPWKYDGNIGIATLLIIDIHFRNSGFVYITNLVSDSAVYLAKYKYGIFRSEDFDNIIFTDRTKAEQRLAELKGGRE